MAARLPRSLPPLPDLLSPPKLLFFFFCTENGREKKKKRESQAIFPSRCGEQVLSRQKYQAMSRAFKETSAVLSLSSSLAKRTRASHPLPRRHPSCQKPSETVFAMTATTAALSDKLQSPSKVRPAGQAFTSEAGGKTQKKKKKTSATAIPHRYLNDPIPVIPQEESLATPERIAAAWEFFRKMGSPKFHVAPMVDQSELAYRMLCRKYGATCAYTPMLHGRLFVEGEKYRKEHFTTCPEDRPLLTQFCAHDPEVLLTAARYVEKDCDGVDINLGCPQRIAKRGNYGAFLMEDLDVVRDMVRKLATELSIPVTCKIRVFPQEEPNGKEKTLQYAKMLQDAGCSLLAVHGRTRDQKRCKEIR